MAKNPRNVNKRDSKRLTDKKVNNKNTSTHFKKTDQDLYTK